MSWATVDVARRRTLRVQRPVQRGPLLFGLMWMGLAVAFFAHGEDGIGCALWLAGSLVVVMSF